ncbi:M15 family metallopeptidase [Mycobacterium sp. NPDC006124]|uniref:M15 family metallopeptidase n=1 Tax=Mycobacterium sp. NPDC006124 TaxID=3156729 RepID=UPI0033A2A0BB
MRAIVVAVAVLVALWCSPGLAGADPGTSPFDVSDPSIAGLEPALRSAVQNAATAAAGDGVTMTITSGWRSPEFQQQLLDDAVQTYGSLSAARRFVQTPEMSKHVVGEAVDVGGAGADQWLEANGSRFGLCRIYANEIWHFELAVDATGTCPPLLPDATSQR